MTDSQRSTLQGKIVADIESCKTDIIQLKEVTKPVAPDASLGRLTRMDNIVNNSVNTSRLAATEARLIRLEQALRNIDEPNFGYCEECGEPIPLPRLLAMPESTLCVECAE